MSDAPKGAILQRDAQTYAIVPRTPCGMLTPENLDAISATCRKFDIPIVKITSGQRLALVGMKADDLDAIWSDLKLDMGEALEVGFHYAQACPGTSVCSKGQQDSLGMGLALEEAYAGQKFPAKVKFGVSGCPLCCGESYVRDIGLIGTGKGWTVVVGGHSGASPRIGDTLAKNLTAEEAQELIAKFLDYYRENCSKKLRVAKFVNKFGIDAIKEALGITE